MAVVKIEWVQNVAGRHVGYRETVELTPFVQGCIDQGRVDVLERIEPVVGVFQPSETTIEPLVAAARAEDPEPDAEPAMVPEDS